MPDLREMMGKEVEVIANGVSYKGTLIEVSDSEVHLRGLLQWISIPASSVSTVRLLGPTKRPAEDETDIASDVSDEDIVRDPSET